MKKGYFVLSVITASLLFSSEFNTSNIKDINSTIFVNNDNNVSKMFALDEAIIVFKDGTMASNMVKTFQSIFGTNMKHNEYNLINGMHIIVPGKNFEQIKSMIENIPIASTTIKSIEKNYANLSFKSNDTYYDKLWAIENTGQNVNNTSGTADADMDVDEAWKLEKGEQDVVVAVLDTGVDYAHTDLADNMWNGNSKHGYDFAGDDDGNNDDDPMPDTPYDDNGHYHGTHVAGIIGAVGDNSNGVSGVAQNVQIMAIKIFRPNGTAYSSDILEGLDYVSKQIDNGVNVVAINASYGGGGEQGDSMDEAIQKLGDKGVVFCAAAGNDGKDIDSDPIYPASYDATNIITVAASDQDDKLASFSNYGKDTVEVAAPGTNILSTYPDNKYAYLQGTSMATPNVTGTVALLASINPSSSVDDRIKAIEDNVDKKSTLTDKMSTNGRVNSYKAVKALSDDSNTNNSPVANDDNTETKYETKVTIDVLKNDTDKDGDSLTIKSVTNPEHGSAVINSAKIDYTPEENFSGTDTFSYEISDNNGGTNSATVTVQVDKKENSTPVANDDIATTNYNTAIIIDVLKNDTDADEDTLSIKSTTSPNNGTVSIANGKIKYSPNSTFSGTDSFEYTITDSNNAEAKAKVTVTVKEKSNNENHSPVANSDKAETKYQTKILIDALKNDTDYDGDTLSLKSVSKPSNGVATIKNGKVEYTPNKGFSGDDKFTYTINDSKGAETNSTIEVKVDKKDNTAPEANDDKATTDYESSVLIDVLNNDTDIDGDNLTIKSITKPSHGTATIQNRKIEYTPDSNFSGNDIFEYTINDEQGAVSSAKIEVVVKEKSNNEYHFPIIGNINSKSFIKLTTNYTKVIQSNYTEFKLANNKADIKVDNNGEIEVKNTKAPMYQGKFPIGSKVEVKQDRLEIQFNMTKNIWFK